MSTGLANTHTARGFSVLYHVFARKQCIFCSVLRLKNYLTLPYFTSIRDSLCLGTFAHGFIRLPPRSFCRVFARGCLLIVIIIIVVSDIDLRYWKRTHKYSLIRHWEGYFTFSFVSKLRTRLTMKIVVVSTCFVPLLTSR